VTYKSGEQETVIDYIMVWKANRKLVQNINAIATVEQAGCVTQHRLLVGKFNIRIEKRRRWRLENRLKVWKLKDNQIRSSFQEKVKKSLLANDPAVNVDDQWEIMTNALIKCTEETCGRTKGQRRNRETWWWNSEVEEAVKVKKESYMRWLNSRSEEDRMAYKMQCKSTRKAVAMAKMTKQIEFADNLETRAGRGKIFKIAKQIANSRRDITEVRCLRSEMGDLLFDQDEVLATWKSYMEKLANETNPFSRFGLDDVLIKQGCCEAIFAEEVEASLKEMKEGKAVGRSEVGAEIFKAAGRVGIEGLTRLFNDIIREERMPEEWNRSILIPLYKGKGDPMDWGSYSAVKLLEHGLNMFERIVDKRQQVKVDNLLALYQKGAR